MYLTLNSDRGGNSTRELELSHKYLNHKEINTQYGKLVQKDINNRHYVVLKTDNAKGILMYYHGSRGNAWMSALEETRWIE